MKQIFCLLLVNLAFGITSAHADLAKHYDGICVAIENHKVIDRLPADVGVFGSTHDDFSASLTTTKDNETISLKGSRVEGSGLGEISGNWVHYFRSTLPQESVNVRMYFHDKFLDVWWTKYSANGNNLQERLLSCQLTVK